ncbi:SIMPL domain-containing protein [Nocardia veterana]|uniref:SIMPL domain-containing protein n=1 Tax=Nocardia veterana TaxID=132249 RepID=A0A7X6LZR4_9NOCA|nr:SIMPL domain-containing protein [Nocardia veterana]NKY87104.1 SIMPL domain-containing protein [Nocardia veterana]
MRRITGTVAVIAGTTLLLSGCGSSDSGTSREVTVVGTGQVRGAPDTLNADVGVEVTAPDVSTAIENANAKASAVDDAMVNAGAKREDIQTTDVSVQPQYGPDQKVTGYTATNTVHVVVRDLPKASAILSAAVRAGGNDTRIRGVSFALDDNSKLLADARAGAFADAKARANQYAVLSGLTLKDVKTINETRSGESAPPQAKTQFATPDVPLEPGQQTVTFTVTVTWNMG